MYHANLRIIFWNMSIFASMIGIFDSGSGGLSVLREIIKILPKEKFVFFADNAFCPYGEKTPEFIRERGRAITLSRKVPT